MVDSDLHDGVRLGEGAQDDVDAIGEIGFLHAEVGVLLRRTELCRGERLWGSEELRDGALLLFGSLIRRRSEGKAGALGGESALDSTLDGATLWAYCLGELCIVCEARQLAWPHEVAVEAVKGGTEIAGS